MLRLVRFIVSVLARRFRRRVVLELEVLALRHQLHVLRRERPGQAAAVCDRSLVLGLPLPIVAALSGSTGVGQTDHRRPMASSGFPPVLAMALEVRAAVSGARD